MTILLVAEHDNSHLNEATSRVLTAATQLGGEVHVLIAGADCASVADQAAALDGVAKVLVADGASLANHLAEPMADLIVGLASDYDAVLAPASAFGKNILPRAAALLDVMQVSDVIEVIDGNTFKRPIYAGNAIETVKCNEPKKLMTIRPTAFAAAGEGGSASIEQVAAPEGDTPTRLVSRDATKSDRPELTSAKIVVSGGRALGSKEQFDALMIPLADKLNAAVGASRAAVDAGYVPNDAQVGQTGKIVAPELYIACGISGAIQHLAGMKDSKVIVAINKDEEAPIFQIADYGLVGDIFELLPELTEKL